MDRIRLADFLAFLSGRKKEMRGVMPNDKLEPCDCGFLERQANLSDSPIRFDPELNEYNFIYSVTGCGKAELRIYHCPFCGGKVPKSKRDTLFATLGHAEMRRIGKLIKHLHTLDDVLRKFGQPDEDHAAGAGITAPERDGKPEATRSYRMVIYTNLSQTANVEVIVYPTDRIEITLSGKYVGKNKP